MKSAQFVLLVAFAVLASSARAFAPAKVTARSPTFLASSSSINTDDAFDLYSTTDPGQGLVYRDIQIGTGDVASKGNVLTVTYTGRLMSTGKQFDEGKGYSFRLGDGKVIPGWEKGLAGMKVGGQRSLRIPPSLAYGDRGSSFVIPANAHLEFDCELKSIASGPVEETIALVNVQKERLITVVLLLILLAVSPQFG